MTAPSTKSRPLAAVRPKAVLETVLYVDDLAGAATFYEDVLRLAPVRDDDRMRVLRVTGESFLLLFRRGGTTAPIETPGGRIPAHDGEGPMHVAFAMDRSEVDAWRDHLEARGIALESTVTWPGEKISFYLRDPSGNLVELATEGLWDT